MTWVAITLSFASPLARQMAGTHAALPPTGNFSDHVLNFESMVQSYQGSNKQNKLVGGELGVTCWVYFCMCVIVRGVVCMCDNHCPSVCRGGGQVTPLTQPSLFDVFVCKSGPSHYVAWGSSSPSSAAVFVVSLSDIIGTHVVMVGRVGPCQ